MKHRFTLLFALLCASIMGWAQYCDYATGHESNANFGDANSRILLSLEPTNNADEFKLTIKPNYTNGATKQLDYLYVIADGNIPYPAESGVDEGGEGYDELSVTFTNITASTNFTIQWSNPAWDGRWQCVLNNVDLDALVNCIGGTEGGLEYDVNFALASNGATATASSGDADLAIDGNENTRWESAATDDETYTLDMGQLRVFNTVKIKWEGAFCSQFELTYSTDGVTYQPLYTETALDAAGWQEIYFETPVTAQYIKYHGTKRATGYGQSFYEFQVLLQEGAPMENIAVGKSIYASSTGNNDVNRVVDGNGGTEWQGSVTNGTTNDEAARTYDAWFIVDLGAFYDIEKVSIVFEGACSQAYHVDFSADNATWKQVFDYTGAAGVNGHTKDIKFDVDNKKVRYVRFWSTKAATEWGMKIFEFQVFGTPVAVEVESIALDPSEATIEIGESKTLVPLFTPAYAVDQTLTWISNNESIVSVTDGVIVGNAEGEAVITATSANGKTATCSITVEPISEKTWWGVGSINGNGWDNMPVMYSITRNIDRTLTYTVYFGGDASGKVMQINNGAWNTLTGYTDSERKASFTTTTTYESGTQIKTNHFFYFGGPRIELADEYVVGASNEKPSTAVESVVISHSTASLMKDETIQLVASVVPAYADDKTLIWSSEDTNIATVANGVVTANAIGTTTITATSANGKTATCNVTVEALTEKTCWGVGNNFEYKETEVSYHYAFTRNADKTLTITAEFSHDITGIGNLNIVWNDIYHLMAYNATTKTATYTTVAGDTYETDAILPDVFFYFEGRRTDVTYIVGSVCDKPIVDVTGVEISNETKKLLTGETFTITANVIPANADNKNIIWSNSNPSVASIDEASGLVTALTTGTTIITATSQFDANLYATCEVTVVGALEPATWYGTAVFKVKGNPVAVNYSITRTSERKLTYRTVLSETVTGMSMQLNDGEYRLMTQDETVRIAEWTSTNTYLDGATHSMFFYPAFEGGADRWDVDYVVGSSNEKPNTLVAFGDQADNTAKITEYADEVVDAYINRTFPNTDEWYTLCLPFDMDESQLAATFGAGYTLATLGNSEDRGSLIHLNFDYVNTLEAGKPYLLRPGVSTATVPMIEAVTIKNVDPSAAPQKAESAHMHFQGTFAPTTLEGDNKRFVGPNNYLYSPAEGGTNMKSFRCYFTIPVESQALVGSKAARIVFGPQVSTGTENVQSDQVQSTKVIIDGTLYIIRGERTYNAQGQLVK